MPSHLNPPYIFHKMVHFLSSNYVLDVLFLIKCEFMRLENHCTLFLITFYTAFWGRNLGCTFSIQEYTLIQ